MSMDFPEYQKMRKEHPILGIFWRVFDCGYYFFSFSTIISPGTVILYKLQDKEITITWLECFQIALLGFLINLLLFLLSSYGKSFIWKLAVGVEKYYKD